MPSHELHIWSCSTQWLPFFSLIWLQNRLSSPTHLTAASHSFFPPNSAIITPFIWQIWPFPISRPLQMLFLGPKQFSLHFSPEDNIYSTFWSCLKWHLLQGRYQQRPSVPGHSEITMGAKHWTWSQCAAFPRMTPGKCPTNALQNPRTYKFTIAQKDKQVPCLWGLADRQEALAVHVKSNLTRPEHVGRWSPCNPALQNAAGKEHSTFSIEWKAKRLKTQITVFFFCWKNALGNHAHLPRPHSGRKLERRVGGGVPGPTPQPAAAKLAQSAHFLLDALDACKNQQVLKFESTVTHQAEDRTRGENPLVTATEDT